MHGLDMEVYNKFAHLIEIGFRRAIVLSEPYEDLTMDMVFNNPIYDIEKGDTSDPYLELTCISARENWTKHYQQKYSIPISKLMPFKKAVSDPTRAGDFHRMGDLVVGLPITDDTYGVTSIGAGFVGRIQTPEYGFRSDDLEHDPKTGYYSSYSSEKNLSLKTVKTTQRYAMGDSYTIEASHFVYTPVAIPALACSNMAYFTLKENQPGLLKGILYPIEKLSLHENNEDLLVAVLGTDIKVNVNSVHLYGKEDINAPAKSEYPTSSF